MSRSCASDDGSVKVWRLPTCEQITTLKVGHPVTALTLFRDNVFVNGKELGLGHWQPK